MNESAITAAAEATPVHPPGFRFRRGINWMLLGLTYASYYICRYNLAIAAPRVMDQFGFSNTGFGTINSARDWCYAFGQFVNGLLTDRLGGKQAMAIGGLLTIGLNVAFGLVPLLVAALPLAVAGGDAWVTPATVALALFVVVRGLDGYAQAFGAPGMIKINTAWFTRSERGRFAGIFGLMIQFGQITINTFGPLLLVTGLTIPLLITTLHLGANDWRILFWVPPVVVAAVVAVMYRVVKNHPEEAGYRVQHAADEDHAHADHEEKIPLRIVFKSIARKKMVWIVAGAYFCTGVVRTAQNAWWVVYFDRQWGLDIAESALVAITGALLPIAAFLGSIGSGFVSDLLFRGRRAPVAVALYGIESLVILISALVLGGRAASPLMAAVMMQLISLTCNSTHSILGAAAAMDLGGRQMAGFASGVIDSFQYIGAGLAGIGLGLLLDRAVETALGWNAWFYFMLPFSLAGMLLMGYVWLATRGRAVHGA